MLRLFDELDPLRSEDIAGNGRGSGARRAPSPPPPPPTVLRQCPRKRTDVAAAVAAAAVRTRRRFGEGRHHILFDPPSSAKTLESSNCAALAPSDRRTSVASSSRPSVPSFHVTTGYVSSSGAGGGGQRQLREVKAVGSLCTLRSRRRRLFGFVFGASDHHSLLLGTFHTRVLRATDEIVEGEEGKRQLISSFSAAAAAPALGRVRGAVCARRQTERRERGACGGRNAHCSESSLARSLGWVADERTNWPPSLSPALPSNGMNDYATAGD